MSNNKKLSSDDILSGGEASRIILDGIREGITSHFQVGKMDNQTTPKQDIKTARFLVPIMETRKFVITEVKIEDAFCDEMRCDGCGNPMGSQNPKGFFKSFDRWYKMCNSCCREQGFIK